MVFNEKNAGCDSAGKLLRLNDEKGAYDPTKPFNASTKDLIRLTHPKDGPIIVLPEGKRFHVNRDADHWRVFHELTCTDGIGTKGSLHWMMNTLEYGVQDAFAMVVDDLIEGGYVPVMLQDHIQVQEQDDGKISRIVKALVDLAVSNPWEAEGKSYPIIVSGGETAIINTLQGFEVGINATGYARHWHRIGSDLEIGDAIIGLGSNGVHSNGLSFFREEFFDKRHNKLDGMLPWGKTIGEELTRPTNIYLPAIKELIKSLTNDRDEKANDYIRGMVHITGGGLSKLKELIHGGSVNVEIRRDHSLKPQDVFLYAHDEFGMPSEQMYKKFNNNVGYAIAIDESHAAHALNVLGKYFAADIIGRVTEGEGKVLIESQYDSSTVPY